VSEAMETKWPVLARHERAMEWLRIWIDLGRAPRTIDAYTRGLAEYLQVCEREEIDPLTATRAQVAVFVRELRSRPSRRASMWWRWTRGQGWRTRPCSSVWCRFGCSTTF
jgi:integrase/recombinase XerD